MGLTPARENVDRGPAARSARSGCPRWWACRRCDRRRPWSRSSAGWRIEVAVGSPLALGDRPGSCWRVHRCHLRVHALRRARWRARPGHHDRPADLDHRWRRRWRHGAGFDPEARYAGLVPRESIAAFEQTKDFLKEQWTQAEEQDDGPMSDDGQPGRTRRPEETFEQLMETRPEPTPEVRRGPGRARGGPCRSRPIRSTSYAARPNRRSTSRPRSGATRSRRRPSSAAPASCWPAGHGGSLASWPDGAAAAAARPLRGHPARRRSRRSSRTPAWPRIPRCGARSTRTSPSTSSRRASTGREPNAAASFWRTFDRVAGPLGTAGARVMVQRLMEAERVTGRVPGRERATAPLDARRG